MIADAALWILLPFRFLIQPHSDSGMPSAARIDSGLFAWGVRAATYVHFSAICWAGQSSDDVTR